MSAFLSPLYLIYGEEELLRVEALDKLRSQAKKQHFDNKEIYSTDAPQFDWYGLLADLGNTGLFSDKKLLEIHIPNGKPGKQGSEVLQKIAENMPKDTVTIVILPKLERSQIQSKWFAALSKNGTVIEAKTVNLTALPEWIRQRLYHHGLHIEDDALSLFVERVEGNLLAAKQEIDKLVLQYEKGHKLNIQETEQAVANVARFDVFQLSSAWMSANPIRVEQLLNNLQADEDTPILPLWVLTEDIRTLIRLSAALKQGQDPHNLRTELKLWGDKIRTAPQAAKRISTIKLISALQECARIDRQIKGAETGNAWDSLSRLFFSLAT